MSPGLRRARPGLACGGGPVLPAQQVLLDVADQGFEQDLSGKGGAVGKDPG